MPRCQNSHLSTTYAADMMVWALDTPIIPFLLRVFVFKCNKIHICSNVSCWQWAADGSSFVCIRNLVTRNIRTSKS